MKLDEIVDDRHLIADDAKRNKGRNIKAIVQSSKRTSNPKSDGKQFISDGPGDDGETKTPE